MQSIACTVPTLAISTIYCLWSFYGQLLRQRRDRILRQRVAFMLWTMIHQVD